MSRSSFRDLRVWQEAMRLTKEIYTATADFPKYEIYGLSQQIRRAAVSVPAILLKVKDIDQTRNLCIFFYTLEARF